MGKQAQRGTWHVSSTVDAKNIKAAVCLIFKVSRRWDLLHGPEKSTQYSGIIHVGKESEREWLYVHVQLNHSVV